MNLSCLLDFHDYQPVKGIWWKYRYKDYKYYPPDLMGVDMIKIFKCSKCNKIHEKCLEYYSKDNFNTNTIVEYLENQGIYHISKFYAE